MKKLCFILSLLVLLCFEGAQALPLDSVQAHLSNIADRVRHCTVQPVTFRNGVKVYHHLVSHCPEVRVLEKGKAQIKVGGHLFHAALVASPETDGDFYDVVIKELESHESYVLKNVPAYGDVLIGVLGGSKAGIPEAYVSGL